MTVDWSHFTPWPSLIGGLVIGLASVLLVLGNGRIAGIAGIVGGALQALMGGQGLRNNAVRWLFLAGLLAAPWIWRIFAPIPTTRVDVGWPAVIVAGLLVGIGVRMGNGCTGGHGVCGLSRRSPRSLANVLAFMGAGAVTVTLLRVAVGLIGFTLAGNWRLVLGGILFGVGWGIAGYCPGPGIVAASSGSLAAGVFVAAMLGGMTIHDRLVAKT